MRFHLLESAQRSLHRFFDEHAQALSSEVRQELMQLCSRIANLRRRLSNRA
jgi:hypothetical protein